MVSPVQPTESVQEKAPTKDRLFATAIEMFSQQGFHAVSIRDLTRAVGIKESSFYNHYPSKDALIEAIYARLETEFSATMPPVERIETNLRQLSPVGFLEQGIKAFIERMTTPGIQGTWRLLFMEQYRDPRARDLIRKALFQQSLDYSTEVFRVMIQQEWTKPLDPRQMAAEYFYPVATLCSNLMLGDTSPGEIEAQLKNHIHFFWNLVKK